MSYLSRDEQAPFCNWRWRFSVRFHRSPKTALPRLVPGHSWHTQSNLTYREKWRKCASIFTSVCQVFATSVCSYPQNGKVNGSSTKQFARSKQSPTKPFSSQQQIPPVGNSHSPWARSFPFDIAWPRIGRERSRLTLTSGRFCNTHSFNSRV